MRRTTAEKRSLARERADARQALRDILNVLGSDIGCSECCEGCQVEMSEARHLAKEALRGTG